MSARGGQRSLTRGGRGVGQSGCDPYATFDSTDVDPLDDLPEIIPAADAPAFPKKVRQRLRW